ncbi:3'(2'),5'-bisphosphate nucleotidase [Rhizobiales bacterium GAS191]|nr:3'(2'),5'-bisphosphate nucleotidase [Rhizobiales bacterium GAS191]SEE41468.1 3'(2'),5'-bisphosphate nucleotidase [Rhizobiales bacterium GAS188]
MKGERHQLSHIEALFVEAAIAAGREIVSIAGCGPEAQLKADGSPVTDADMRAETLIRARLGASLPDIPIIGEEGGASCATAAALDALILVDPLDGTRDFLAGSHEFTVNIAFIEHGRAVVGVVHAPALGRLFAGHVGGGACEIAVGPDGAFDALAQRRPISVRPVEGKGPIALESRSHREPATEALLASLRPAGRRCVGSSLKFALIAAGEADLYARGVSLNGWDIAAGDAVLTAAGGAVLSLQDEPIRYGGATPKAPPFIAIGDPGLRALIRRQHIADAGE